MPYRVTLSRRRIILVVVSLLLGMLLAAPSCTCLLCFNQSALAQGHPQPSYF